MAGRKPRTTDDELRWEASVLAATTRGQTEQRARLLELADRIQVERHADQEAHTRVHRALTRVLAHEASRPEWRGEDGDRWAEWRGLILRVVESDIGGHPVYHGHVTEQVDMAEDRILATAAPCATQRAAELLVEGLARDWSDGQAAGSM